MTFDIKGQQQVIQNDYYQYVPSKIFYLTKVFIYPLNKKLKAYDFSCDFIFEMHITDLCKNMYYK